MLGFYCFRNSKGKLRFTTLNLDYVRDDKKTDQKVWGDKYEIVVTTHLNTDNLHNHIVVNSVSFKNGKKFGNHISDHYKLREISDEVCRSRGKSVLENFSFYGRSKGERRAQMSGVPTHHETIYAVMQ